MDGTIEVDSTIGKGTVFTLTVPIRRKAKREEVNQALSEQEKIPVSNSPEDYAIDLNTPLLLIVEDNKDVAGYVASCIESQYRIIFANNGKEGVTKAIKYIPDIIITDLMMPEMNGFELCQKLKNDTATSHIPIVMLTARSLEQDKLKGYSAGADAYLIKPFNKKELLVRIEQLTELRKKLQKKYSSSASSFQKPVTTEDEFLNKLYTLIDNNLDNADYKSANLSANMNFSESQMYRKIKALTDSSTALFIRNRRLEKAKKMLLHTGINISEIAYRCGFNDPAWFTRAFKEMYKTSPSDIRK